jgi:pyruvate/2-oxoglutarate dehydrogenase complex dihydrolipoamide dehydrogenase (E3) component
MLCEENGMHRLRFDLVVIGGGSAGYAAARTARDLGASVAIVEQGPLGGLCILRGCMPSKALLASADAAQRVREAHRLGIHAGAPIPDMHAVIHRKRRLIAEFAEYRGEQLERFPLFMGRARFLSPTTLAVGDDHEFEAGAFIIATGSVTAAPPVPGLVELGYITSDDVLDSEHLPKSIICLGGGYVACELGQYYHRMGVKTQLLLRAQHVLSSEDQDVGESLTEALRAEGMTVTTGAQISHAERAADGKKVIVYLLDGVEHRAVADEVAMFLGRVPAIDGLDLDAAEVRCHAVTGIEVDEYMRTCQSHIFAIGDVTGSYQLVHVAIAEGEVAARNALRKEQESMDYSLQKAHTIFTEPQVAIAGETERELKKLSTPYITASYAYADHGKAMTLERTAGFVKMMADPQTGRILGAAIVGAEASELIHELIVAMSFEATVQQFIRIPHLHPTLAEIWTYPAEELAEQIALRNEAVPS